MATFNSVLLVDDSEIDALVNRRLIELTSFASQTITTTSGEEALKYLEECSYSNAAPDWIFLDMFLPGMSGFEFIEAFKSLPDFIKNKSRIIVLSVYQKQEAIDEVMKYPFVAGQIEKPLTQQALRSLVEKTKAGVNVSS